MDNRIHVLQVSKSTGGAGHYLRSLVYGLDKKHFKVTVVFLSDESEKLAIDLSRVDGVNVLSYKMDRYRINPFTDALVWWKLTRLIRQERFDLIHAHVSKPGFLARIAAVGTGIPVIYCPACFSFHDGVARWKALLYSVIERTMAAWFTNKIVCQCNDEHNLALRYHVGAEEQLLTIYSGVDESQFAIKVNRKAIRKSLGIPEFAFLVGCVGRLSKQKAPADFVKAAALVHKEFPLVHFVWIGDGELMENAQALAISLGIGHVIHFVGYRHDIADQLQVLDCFVLVSHWEGFSLSVLEAMAAGLPVIMSRVSGAGEAVVDGETGRLVPINGAKELAAAIVDMVTNPGQAVSFGKAGQLRVKQLFTLNRMISAIEDLYFELIQQKIRVSEKNTKRENSPFIK